MRIISVNAWGGAMFAALAAWVGTAGADVVCLQEVARTPSLRGWTRFGDGERELPQRADLFDDLRLLLPGHDGTFVASDAGPVSDESGGRHRQEFGLATFVDRRLTTIAVETAFVHGTFVDHGEWPIRDRPRAALATRVVDPAGDRAVTVVQCHGLRDPAGKHDTAARRQQAERLAAFIVEARQPDDLTVVCGDLNLLPDSETFDTLAKIGLLDLVGTSDTRTSRYPKSVRHASYLFVSDRQAVEGFQILSEPEVSDHRALQLDLLV